MKTIRDWVCQVRARYTGQKKYLINYKRLKWCTLIYENPDMEPVGHLGDKLVQTGRWRRTRRNLHSYSMVSSLILYVLIFPYYILKQDTKRFVAWQDFPGTNQRNQKDWVIENFEKSFFWSLTKFHVLSITFRLDWDDQSRDEWGRTYLRRQNYLSPAGKQLVSFFYFFKSNLENNDLSAGRRNPRTWREPD